MNGQMNGQMNGRTMGRRMVALRREHGLTRRRLAELARLSQGQVSRLENGRQPFRSETLFRVADALRVEPYRLLLPSATTGDDEAASAPPELDRVLREALRDPEYVSLLEEIARAYRTSPEGYRAVESVIATVLAAPVSPAHRQGKSPATRRAVRHVGGGHA